VIASLTLFGAAGIVYLIGSLLFTAYFAWMAWKLFRSRDNKFAMPLFHYSCLYLFGVFGALIVDRLLSLTWWGLPILSRSPINSEEKNWVTRSRSFWLGDESTSLNTNRFWVYLAAICATLCLVCLVKSLRTSWEYGLSSGVRAFKKVR
jgi:hypothetical protein